MRTAFGSLFLSVASLVYIVLVSGGCGTSMSTINPNPVLKSGQDFVSAANALVQAESDYFNEIQTASDSGYQLRAIRDCVAKKKSWDLIAKELKQKDDFSTAKNLRLNVMKQLQNYAEVINSILSGADASWISGDAQNLINDTGNLIQDFKGAQLTAAQNGIIRNVVTILGEAVVRAAVARELHVLAKQAQEPIQSIVDMVESDSRIIEDSRFASGLGADQTFYLVEILHDIYNDKQTNASQRFAAARTIVNWKPSLVARGQAIKAAVSKLQTANEVLAKDQQISAIALARQAATIAAGATGMSASK